MRRFVVYSIMTGGYEDVLQPLVVDDRFDYILFSNDFKVDKIGVWSIRPIPSVIENDNKRLSRYPKSHPECMLSEYDYSLYHDANIQISDKWIYERFITLVSQGVVYAGVQLVLTGRDCIYRHALDMSLEGAEHDYNALRECRALYKEGFPEHFGLNENNIIFRQHSEIMKKADEEWWRWITEYSFRDQFSYMFCLWKYNIPINYFLPLGEDAHNSSHFVFHEHNSMKTVSSKKWVKKGLCEKVRDKSFAVKKKQSSDYWVFICRLPFTMFWLHIGGLVFTILSFPYYLSRVVKLVIGKSSI